MKRRTTRVGLLTILVTLLAVLGCVPQMPGTPTLPPVRPPLEDTSWSLETLGQPGNMRPALVNREVTLSFVSDSQANGSAGCNSYGASYASTIDGSISFTDIFSTEMYCVEPGVMDQEQFFLETLRDAEAYEVVDGKLRISGGGRLLVLAKA
jgi:heat shock protein HslJ